MPDLSASAGSPRESYQDSDDGFFTCEVSVQHKFQNQETEEVTGVGRVVLWPALPPSRPLTPAAPVARAATHGSFRPPPPPADVASSSHPFHWIPRIADGTEEREEGAAAGEGAGRRGRSRSRSRAIMERARSFERPSSGQQEVSKDGRLPVRHRSPSGEDADERPASRTDVDSRRFAETIGRVNTQDWEQRIHQQGSAENVAAAVAAAPPPPRRRQQDGLKLKEGDGKVVVLNITRLTEERVNLLEDEEVRETMVKAWVESTSSENLHEKLEQAQHSRPSSRAGDKIAVERSKSFNSIQTTAMRTTGLHGPVYIQDQTRPSSRAGKEVDKEQKIHSTKNDEKRKACEEKNLEEQRQQKIKDEAEKRQQETRGKEELRKKEERLKKAAEEQQLREDKKRREAEQLELETAGKEREEQKQQELRYEQLRQVEEAKRLEEIRLEQEIRRQFELCQLQQQQQQQHQDQSQHLEANVKQPAEAPEKDTAKPPSAHVPRRTRTKSIKEPEIQISSSHVPADQPHLLGKVRTGQVSERRNFWIRSSSADRLGETATTVSPAPRRRQLTAWHSRQQLATEDDGAESQSRPGSSLGQSRNTGSVKQLTSGLIARSKSSLALISVAPLPPPTSRTTAWTKEKLDQQAATTSAGDSGLKSSIKLDEIKTNQVKETLSSYAARQERSGSAQPPERCPTPTSCIRQVFAENMAARRPEMERRPANAWRTRATPEPCLRLVNVSVSSRAEVAAFTTTAEATVSATTMETTMSTSDMSHQEDMQGDSAKQPPSANTASRHHVEERKPDTPPAIVLPPPAPERNQSFAAAGKYRPLPVLEAWYNDPEEAKRSSTSSTEAILSPTGTGQTPLPVLAQWFTHSDLGSKS